MNNLVKFNEFIYDNNYQKINESIDLEIYQKLIKKFFKETKIQLYYVSKFETTFSVLLPIVEKFIKLDNFNIEINNRNILILTIYAFSLLINESKDKVYKIYELMNERNIGDDDIKKIVNLLRNIKILFSTSMKSIGKSINSFFDMISYTPLLIPFLSTFNSLIDDGKINTDLFLDDTFESSVDTKDFKLIIHRILHKLTKVIGSDNKFQNKSNIKPLTINDDLKSPMYKTENTYIYDNIDESIKNLLVGPTEEEIYKNLGLNNSTLKELFEKSLNKNFYFGMMDAIDKGFDINNIENILFEISSTSLNDDEKLNIIKYIDISKITQWNLDNATLKISLMYNNNLTLEYLLQNGADVKKLLNNQVIMAWLIDRPKTMKILNKYKILPKINKPKNMSSISKFKRFLHLEESVKKLLVGPSEEEVLNGLMKLKKDDMLIKSFELNFIKGIQYAIDRGANITEHNLLVAARNNHFEIVEILLKNGVDVHFKNDEPARIASYYSNIESLKIILDYMYKTDKKSYSYYFYWGVEQGEIEFVKWLLEKNIKFNDFPKALKNAELKNAEFNNNNDMVELLKKYEKYEKL